MMMGLMDGCVLVRVGASQCRLPANVTGTSTGAMTDLKTHSLSNTVLICMSAQQKAGSTWGFPKTLSFFSVAWSC